MRVAIYLRVSTTRQAEQDLSIPDQQRQIEAFCASRGWNITHRFVEPGASATDDQRPEFQKMMALAKMKPDAAFDAIIVHSLSRFYRDHIALGLADRELTKNRVKLISITQEFGDDPMGKMVRHFVAIFDEYQSQENAKHTSRGMCENARQGFWNGSVPPFGFAAEEAERRGHKIKKRLAINPDEAEIVRLIFKLCLEGASEGPLGVKAISEHLNSAGYRYRGKPFQMMSVHRILRSEACAGRQVFNRTSSKDGQLKPEHEWVYYDIPAIIDRETFDAAGDALSARSPKRCPPRLVTSPVLLTGVLTCGTCGSGMRADSSKGGRYHYYCCSRATRVGGYGCPGRRIRMDGLDDLIVDHMAERLFVPDRARELLDGHVSRSGSRATEGEAMIKALDRRIKDADLGLENLYRAIELGKIDLDDDLRARISKKKIEKQELVRHRAEADSRHQQSPKRLEEGRINEFCERMQRELRTAGVGVKKALIRGLVSKIVLNDDCVEISGKLDALHAKANGAPATSRTVPGFIQEWRPRGDSNTRPTV